MANKETLKPEAHKLTKEDRSKGGKNSAISRREKKAIKSVFDELLSMPMKDGKMTDIEKIKSLANIKGENLSVQDALCLAMIQKALRGDIKAFLSIIEIVGQTTGAECNEETDELAQAIENAAKLVWQTKNVEVMEIDRN